MLLFSGIMISLSLGMLCTLVLKKLLPQLPVADEKFYSFVISGVSFQGVALLLTHHFLRQHGMSWSEFLGLNQPTLRQSLLITLGVIAVASPVAMLLNEASLRIILLFRDQAEMQPTMKILEVSLGPVRRTLFGLTAIVLAPLVEEILFRALLYPTIKELGYPRAAIFGTALLFAAIHGSLMTMLPLFFLALAWTLLYEKTNTLLAPIVAHSVFNAVNFFMFLSQQA